MAVDAWDPATHPLLRRLCHTWLSIASCASKPCFADTPCQLFPYHSRPQKRNLTSVYSVHKQYLPCRLLSDCKTRKADNHLRVALATKDALAGGAHSCQDEGFAALANYRRCPPGGDEQLLDYSCGVLVASLLLPGRLRSYSHSKLSFPFWSYGGKPHAHDSMTCTSSPPAPEARQGVGMALVAARGC